MNTFSDATLHVLHLFLAELGLLEDLTTQQFSKIQRVMYLAQSAGGGADLGYFFTGPTWHPSDVVRSQRLSEALSDLYMVRNMPFAEADAKLRPEIVARLQKCKEMIQKHHQLGVDESSWIIALSNTRRRMQLEEGGLALSPAALRALDLPANIPRDTVLETLKAFLPEPTTRRPKISAQSA